jgi:hypothetical protein
MGKRNGTRQRKIEKRGGFCHNGCANSSHLYGHYPQRAILCEGDLGKDETSPSQPSQLHVSVAPFSSSCCSLYFLLSY